MFSHVPLDDQLNHAFYLQGGIWTLVYAWAQRRCVYRRELKYVHFACAIAWIQRGELLWVPPPRFFRLEHDTPIGDVEQEAALLAALFASPVGRRIPVGELRPLERRLLDNHAWLIRRADGVDAGD